MDEKTIVEKVVTAVNKETGEVFETTFVGTEAELKKFQKKFEEEVNSIKKLPEVESVPVYEELEFEEELPAFDLEEPILEEAPEEEIPTFDLTDDQMFLEDVI